MKLKTEGMHCNGCEALLIDVLEELGANNVKADHKTGIISFENLDEKKAARAIKSEGYKVL